MLDLLTASGPGSKESTIALSGPSRTRINILLACVGIVKNIICQCKTRIPYIWPCARVWLYLWPYVPLWLYLWPCAHAQLYLWLVLPGSIAGLTAFIDTCGMDHN